MVCWIDVIVVGRAKVEFEVEDAAGTNTGGEIIAQQQSTGRIGKLRL